MIKTKVLLFIVFSSVFLLSCQENIVKKIFIPKNIVIAHRGSTFHTPEETEAAYLWARNIGADYLEVDIQRSKDGVLLALHDMQLTRTTNIEQVYPEKKELSANNFTFEELLLLDAGSWFNTKNPERSQIAFSSVAEVNETKQVAFYFDEKGEKKIYLNANRKVYIGGKLGISTLEDVIRIAEGYRVAKDSVGNRLYKKYEKDGRTEYRLYYVVDTSDIGHRPGVYIETKEPQLFPNVEKELFNKLDQLGWNILTHPQSDTVTTKNGMVNIGNTSAKIILQTFSPKSLKNLFMEFHGKVPTCFLLWLGDPNMMKNDSITYFKNLEWAKKYRAQIIGPSIAGEPNNYDDLLTEKNYKWIRSYGFLIHPYAFDTYSQAQLYGNFCDGMFTNRAEITIDYYKKINKR